MRWLFLLLLVLNLTYIAWQEFMPVKEGYANVPPLKNVQTIVLLEESRKLASASDGATSNVSKVIKKVKPTIESSEKLAVTSEQVVEKAVVEAGKQEVAAPERAVAKSCFTLGPFREVGVLRKLTQEIKPYVLATDFRGKEEKGRPIYWVYINPEKNYKQAVKTGKRLKAKKIKDFYVIRDGEKINGISLGHFRNKAGAFGLVKKVKRLGFDVVIEPVYKTYTAYWLDYQFSENADVIEPIVTKYINSEKKQKISRLSRNCN